MNEFFVNLPCGSYAKRFIEHNFGNPANLKTHKDLQDLLIRSIKKPNKRFDSNKRMVEAIGSYNHKIDLVISEDLFYRYGWMLSYTDILAINRKIEGMAKCFMHQMVGVAVSNGKPIKDSIEDFQERFDFSEDVWAYETIKKEFQRHGRDIARNYQKEIIKINQQLFMENLSRVGTILPNSIKYYEKHQQTIGA